MLIFKSYKKIKRLESFLKGFDIQSVIIVCSRMHAMFKEKREKARGEGFAEWHWSLQFLFGFLLSDMERDLKRLRTM